LLEGPPSSSGGFCIDLHLGEGPGKLGPSPRVALTTTLGTDDQSESNQGKKPQMLEERVRLNQDRICCHASRLPEMTCQ